jgi:hypothetical protein
MPNSLPLGPAMQLARITANYHPTNKGELANLHKIERRGRDMLLSTLVAAMSKYGGAVYIVTAKGTHVRISGVEDTLGAEKAGQP